MALRVGAARRVAASAVAAPRFASVSVAASARAGLVSRTAGAVVSRRCLAAAAAGAPKKADSDAALEKQIEEHIKVAEAERLKEDQLERDEEKRGVVRAPIRIFGLSGNYAHALFEAAATTDSLQKVDAQLSAFGDIVRSDPVYDELFTNPAIKAADAKRLLQALLVQAAGGNAKEVVPVLQAFFKTLFENRRLNMWDEISADYAKLFKATRNEIDATLTISGPMYQKDIELIKRYVQDYVVTPSDQFYQGKSAKMNLDVVIDPEIEGGFVVKFGDNIIDFSHKLARSAFQEKVTEGLNAAFDSRFAKLNEAMKNM